MKQYGVRVTSTSRAGSQKPVLIPTRSGGQPHRGFPPGFAVSS